MKNKYYPITPQPHEIAGEIATTLSRFDKFWMKGDSINVDPERYFMGIDLNADVWQIKRQIEDILDTCISDLEDAYSKSLDLERICKQHEK